MIYIYEGTDEVNLPTLGITVNKGDKVDSSTEINHPDFRPVVGDDPKGKKDK